MSSLLGIVLFTSVFAASGFAQDLVIFEFAAGGSSGFRDADGDESDWIEIANLSGQSHSLGGLFLTDDLGDPTRWQFPELEIGPSELLVVFASGKNRRDPSEELHTSFRLDLGGEYLALIDRDGVSAIFEYAPSYPEQRGGYSYGLTAATFELVDTGSDVEVLIPSNDALGLSWTDPGFAPAAPWIEGSSGVGYAREANDAPPEGLVAYWTFDSTLADDFGDHDGTHVGGVPRWVAGFDGGAAAAIEFDGSSTYVEVATGAGLPIYNTPAFSVSMWVRGGPQSDKRVFSEGSGTNNTPVFNIGTDRTGSSGRVDIYIRDANGSTPHPHTLSSGIAFDGTWHHIAWVDGGGDAKLYIDGVEDATNFSYAKPNLPVNRTSIGAILRATSSFHFDGSIDEVSVWNRTLSAAEVAALAAGNTPSGVGGSSYDSWIATDVEAEMFESRSSAYVRVPFEVDDPLAIDTLALRMRYDDGFIAYLNGEDVARRNAPAQATWSSTASVERDAADALTTESISLSDHLDLLVAGSNVLAIHGLNADANDDEFLIVPELVGFGATASQARFFRTPTPGEPNDGGFIDFVGDTRFSVDRGYHDEPFDVEISCQTPDAEIRYTLDGSAPTSSHGAVYDGPLRIDTTTTLRGAAFVDGFEPSNVDTHTYIFVEDVLRQTRPDGYPTSWSGTPGDYDMDSEIVDHPAHAGRMVDALRSLPAISLVLDPDHFLGPQGIYQNPTSSGPAWERPISSELIHTDGRAGFQIDSGVRITGNRSRSPANSPKHGLRLIFRSQYGAAKLEYPLFPDSPVERFDTLSIKPNAFDSWVSDNSSQRQGATYLRDQHLRDAQRDTGHPTSHGFFVHLYINGIYWGVYNLGERPDASWAAEHFGGEKESWDAVKNHEELVDGSLTAYRELDSLRQQDLSNDANYAAVLDYVDAPNMIDYMIVNMFAPATDWPGNYYMVRERAPGAGFKFISWDAEYAYLGGVNNNRTLPHRRDADSPTKFYHAMRANEEFRVLFGDHVQRHLFHGGALTAESVDARWLVRANEIELALIAESARWGDYRRSAPYRPDVEWQAENDYLLNDYIPQRTAILLGQFRDLSLYPDVDAPNYNQHGGEIEPGFVARVSATGGTVYYTRDGSDHRDPGGAISAGASIAGESDQAVLLDEGAAARAIVPTDDSLGTDWIGRDFDDETWRAGTTGAGFERTTGYENLIGLDLEDVMDGNNATLYLRVPFEVEGASAVDLLRFSMKYDDGYIAYLNGREIARRNAPVDSQWDSRATAPHSDSQATVFEDVDVTEHRDALVDGRNVLAIHGLNSSPTSSDCLLLPRLSVSASSGDGIVLDETTKLRARARAAGEWSALTEAVFAIDPKLRVTEIQYHPAPDPDSGFEQDEFEFIELENVGDEVLDLRDFRFDVGIEFDFSEGAVHEFRPGEIVVLVENVRAFASRYDLGSVLVAGEYRGKLANDGERLRIVGSLGENVLEFDYSDAWVPESDGLGSSLVFAAPIRGDEASPRSAWGDGANWQASREELGSPGVPETGVPTGGQLPGNLNQDGHLDLSDAVSLLQLLFLGGEALPCGDQTLSDSGNVALLDANGDTQVNLSDGIHLLAYLFQGGPRHAAGVDCIVLESCPSTCIP